MQKKNGVHVCMYHTYTYVIRMQIPSSPEIRRIYDYPKLDEGERLKKDLILLRQLLIIIKCTKEHLAFDFFINTYVFEIKVKILIKYVTFIWIHWQLI